MRKVLVVDDEVAIAFAFERMLRSPEVIVDSAQSVEGAREQIDRNKYDAAVVDLRLTGVDDYDGLDVVRCVRSSQPECKVIVMTAYGGKEIRAKVLDAGADLYLEKPVSAERMKRTLGSMGIYGPDGID